MKPLRSARAGRPVKARVRTVSVNLGSASAARCVVEAPLSSVSRSRLPTATPTAPAASRRRTAAGPSTPPVAMTGRPASATTDRTRSSSGTGAGNRCGSRVALCAPAPLPWTTRPSTPVSRAARASAGVVTVASTRLPARRRAATSRGAGSAKVRETTGTGRSRSSASFAGQWSSSSTGSAAARSRPYGSPSGWSRAAYARKAASSSRLEPGTKRLTPKGRPAERTSSTAVERASGVAYPPARNGKPPAPATARANATVLGPPAIGAAAIGSDEPRTPGMVTAYQVPPSRATTAERRAGAQRVHDALDTRPVTITERRSSLHGDAELGGHRVATELVEAEEVDPRGHLHLDVRVAQLAAAAAGVVHALGLALGGEDTEDGVALAGDGVERQGAALLQLDGGHPDLTVGLDLHGVAHVDHRGNDRRQGEVRVGRAAVGSHPHLVLPRLQHHAEGGVQGAGVERVDEAPAVIVADLDGAADNLEREVTARGDDAEDDGARLVDRDRSHPGLRGGDGALHRGVERHLSPGHGTAGRGRLLGLRLGGRGRRARRSGPRRRLRGGLVTAAQQEDDGGDGSGDEHDGGDDDADHHALARAARAGAVRPAVALLPLAGDGVGRLAVGLLARGVLAVGLLAVGLLGTGLLGVRGLAVDLLPVALLPLGLLSVRRLRVRLLGGLRHAGGRLLPVGRLALRPCLLAGVLLTLGPSLLAEGLTRGERGRGLLRGGRHSAGELLGRPVGAGDLRVVLGGLVGRFPALLRLRRGVVGGRTGPGGPGRRRRAGRGALSRSEVLRPGRAVPVAKSARVT